MALVAGSAEHGYVWSTSQGLYSRKPAQLNVNFDYYRNFTILGGIHTVVAYKSCRWTEEITILIIQLKFDVPRVSAFHIHRANLLDITASDQFVYLAVDTGLEVFSLPDFCLVQHWPGKFFRLVALPDQVLAASDAAGKVMFLRNSRWDAVEYAVYVTSNAHYIMNSYLKPWCVLHRHRLYADMPDYTIAGVCDGIHGTYVTHWHGRYTIYRYNRPVWVLTAVALRLEVDQLTIATKKHHVHVWPATWWGRRLAVLFCATNIPLALLQTIKKIIGPQY